MTAAFRITQSDPASADALLCLASYYAELNARFDGGFDVSLSRDPDAADMRPPRGAFLVAYDADTPVACVGVKGTDHGYAEIKRLWVSPTTRGRGLARQIMASAEDTARALGIPTLKLDTNSALPEAAALYHATGWTQIARFNDDPYPDLFFEKHL